jgi:hypothetical protein
LASSLESRQRAPQKTRRLGALAWTALVALVALASSILALVFELWPGLRPDPRVRLGGAVSVFAVDPGVSYGEHLRRVSRSSAASGDTNADGQANGEASLKRVGEEVYARTTIEGFKRRSISMRVSMYEAATRVRVPTLSDIGVAETGLQAPSDTFVVQLWVPCPRENGKRYFVQIEVYHRGDHVLLAVADSKRFSASGCWNRARPTPTGPFSTTPQGKR